MNTTAVAFETVLIGFQVLVWAVIYWATFGHPPFPPFEQLPALSGWATPFTVALIAFSYMLGIVFDYFAGLVLRPVTLPLFRRARVAGEEPGPVMWAYVSAAGAHLSEDLYRRNRRSTLLRATVLNLVLIINSSALFLSRRADWPPIYVALAVVLSAIVVFFAVVAWLYSVRSDMVHLKLTYDILIAKEQSGRSEQTAPAA